MCIYFSKKIIIKYYEIITKILISIVKYSAFSKSIVSQFLLSVMFKNKKSNFIEYFLKPQLFKKVGLNSALKTSKIIQFLKFPCYKEKRIQTQEDKGLVLTKKKKKKSYATPFSKQKYTTKSTPPLFLKPHASFINTQSFTLSPSHPNTTAR